MRLELLGCHKVALVTGWLLCLCNKITANCEYGRCANVLCADPNLPKELQSLNYTSHHFVRSTLRVTKSQHDFKWVMNRVKLFRRLE